MIYSRERPMDLYAHVKSCETLSAGPRPKSVELLSREYPPDVSPKIPHWIVQSNMLAILRELAGQRGITGPELHVRPGRVDGSGRVVVPDVAFVSWERLEAVLPEDAEQPTSPDVAVEIRSPSNDRAYIAEKVALYLATGSLLVLDVVPAERAIIAYHPEGRRRYESNEVFERLSVKWLRFSVARAFEFLDRIER